MTLRQNCAFDAVPYSLFIGEEDGVEDGVVTKVRNDTIFDLQYADDAALPSHTPDGLQRQLDATLPHTLLQDWSLTPNKRKSYTQAHNQLGTRGGAKSFLRGAQII